MPSCADPEAHGLTIKGRLRLRIRVPSLPQRRAVSARTCETHSEPIPRGYLHGSNGLGSQFEPNSASAKQTPPSDFDLRKGRIRNAHQGEAPSTMKALVAADLSRSGRRLFRPYRALTLTLRRSPESARNTVVCSRASRFRPKRGGLVARSKWCSIVTGQIIRRRLFPIRVEPDPIPIGSGFSVSGPMDSGLLIAIQSGRWAGRGPALAAKRGALKKSACCARRFRERLARRFPIN